ncbi:hypothetical protein GCM10023321_33840 [Pseudonocardia eucalypti]|uniref:DUF2076 domain-containing protein n=1 Tax=Pseudonocardia eucalypti TaxID=648755 RepID=A0ABP9QAG9_9PSEU|nr:hypothetical protein [Pseudonocardia eucalypti]
MGLFDKIKERLAPPAAPHQQGAGMRPAAPAAPTAGSRDPDEVAIERYRYMLKTAPPETIEQAHAEAFAKLTPEQRQQVLNEMSTTVPPSERATSTEPKDLARMATRAEMAQPGTMERTLGGGRRGGMGMGMGGMIAGTLLASVAGAFIGTAIADAFFDDEPGGGEDMAAAEPEPEADAGADDGGFGDFGDFGDF